MWAARSDRRDARMWRFARGGEEPSKACDRSPRMSRTTLVRRAAAGLLATGVAVAMSLTGAGSASAAPTWAPASSATIHPGVMTTTSGSQCTANFVYTDGTNVYLGQAAHCSGTDGNTATNGCTSHSLPVGTAVQVDGASKPGVMVYNSWLTMQSLGETDADTCQYNDLALVKLDPADVGKVNPSVPYWGGPTGLGGATASGEDVFSYGNSSLGSASPRSTRRRAKAS